MSTAIPHPEVVSRAEWLAQRKSLLEAEKELTKHYDRVNARRRRLPMVHLEKQYTFDGPEGAVKLLDLFANRQQLIVYHFMFDPTWDHGCPGCTRMVNGLGDLSLLDERNTSFALVSRAPLSKLQLYKQQQQWNWPWYSSFQSDFNYDFHVTQDKKVVALEYNYRRQEELEARQETEPYFVAGEAHGLSDAYRLLDLTPYGRQEDFEDSPAGWPQKPTYGS